MPETPDVAAVLRELPPGMTLTLKWWARDGVVQADVPAPTKTGLVRRGLAEWAPGDDLCPRLTDLGIQIRDWLLAETPDPTTERTDKP